MILAWQAGGWIAEDDLALKRARRAVLGQGEPVRRRSFALVSHRRPPPWFFADQVIASVSSVQSIIGQGHDNTGTAKF